MFGVANHPVSVFTSLPIPFELGPIQRHHLFYLVLSALIQLLGQDFLGAHQGHNSFSQKGEIFLNIEPPNPNLQENLDILISLPILSLKHPNSEPIFDSIPETLWSKSDIDIGRIHSVPLIKIQIDERKKKPLLNIKQYPLNVEAIQGIKPTTEDFFKEINCPYTSPCNTPILPSTGHMEGDGDLHRILEQLITLYFLKKIKYYNINY